MGTAMLPTASHAVTPDNGQMLSQWWNFGELFNSWFDWKSYIGWGSVAAVNVAALTMSGASLGTLTTASFSALCGSFAAGLNAKWQPRAAAESTAGILAMVKAGSVTAAATGCGWIASQTFAKYDVAVGQAITKVNTLNEQQLKDLSAAKKLLVDASNNAENMFMKIADTQRAYDKASVLYQTYECKFPLSQQQQALCNSIAEIMERYGKDTYKYGQAIFNWGKTVKANAERMAAIVRI